MEEPKLESRVSNLERASRLGISLTELEKMVDLEEIAKGERREVAKDRREAAKDRKEAAKDRRDKIEKLDELIEAESRGEAKPRPSSGRTGIFTRVRPLFTNPNSESGGFLRVVIPITDRDRRLLDNSSLFIRTNDPVSNTKDSVCDIIFLSATLLMVVCQFDSHDIDSDGLITIRYGKVVHQAALPLPTIDPVNLTLHSLNARNHDVTIDLTNNTDKAVILNGAHIQIFRSRTVTNQGLMFECFWTRYGNTNVWQLDFQLINGRENGNSCAWANSTLDTTYITVGDPRERSLLHKANGSEYIPLGGKYQRTVYLFPESLSVPSRADSLSVPSREWLEVIGIAEEVRSFYLSDSFGPWKGRIPRISNKYSYQGKTGFEALTSKVNAESGKLITGLLQGTKDQVFFWTENIGMYHPVDSNLSYAPGGDRIRLQPGWEMTASSLGFWRYYSEATRDRTRNHYFDANYTRPEEWKLRGWNLARNETLHFEGFEDTEPKKGRYWKALEAYHTHDAAHGIREYWMEICLFWWTGSMLAATNLISTGYEYSLAWSADYNQNTRFGGQYSIKYRLEHSEQGKGYNSLYCGREMGWIASIFACIDEINVRVSSESEMLAKFIAKATMANGAVAYEAHYGANGQPTSNTEPWDLGIGPEYDPFQVFQLEIAVHGYRCLQRINGMPETIQDDLQDAINRFYTFIFLGKQAQAPHPNIGPRWWISLRKNGVPIAIQPNDPKAYASSIEWQYQLAMCSYAGASYRASFPIQDSYHTYPWDDSNLWEEAISDGLLESTIDKSAHLIALNVLNPKS